MNDGAPDQSSVTTTTNSATNSANTLPGTTSHTIEAAASEHENANEQEIPQSMWLASCTVEEIVYVVPMTMVVVLFLGTWY